MKVRDGSIQRKAGTTGFLLIHGLGQCPQELRHLTKGLGRKGLTASCPLLPGHGGSAADLASCRWTDWAACVEDEHARLRLECETVIVCGASLGASLALNLAASPHSAVDGLVLLYPTCGHSGWTAPWDRFISRVLTDCAGPHIAGLDFRRADTDAEQSAWAFNLDQMASGRDATAARDDVPEAARRQQEKLTALVNSQVGKVDVPALIFHSQRLEAAQLATVFHVHNQMRGVIQTLTFDDNADILSASKQRLAMLDKMQAFATTVDKRRHGRGLPLQRRLQLEAAE